MAKTLIQFDKVGLTLGGRHILKNISLDIHAQEIISIIGVNGAGKTSLLKLIAGIYKASSGKITRHTKAISYVPQKLHFDESLTITVLDFLSLYNPTSSLEQINTLLTSLHAQDLIHVMMGKLSGGQLQRILIVQSLLQEPEVILLDEPTAGIDAMGADSFFTLVYDLHKNYNLTIILVSHDIHTVFANSTKVICLNKHICCVGKPDDVSKEASFQEVFGHYLAPYHHHHDQCVHHEH